MMKTPPVLVVSAVMTSDATCAATQTAINLSIALIKGDGTGKLSRQSVEFG